MASNFERGGGQSNEAGIEFIKTDVETGLIFAEIALQAPEHSEKRYRNQANARKAYDAVLYWSKRLSFGVVDVQEFQHRLIQLQTALERLGERF